MVSSSRLWWIRNFSDHRRIWTTKLLHAMQLPKLLSQETLWPSRLGNCIECKRFAIQTFLWSLEFAIHLNIDDDTITVLYLVRSWSISSWKRLISRDIMWTINLVWKRNNNYRIMFGILRFESCCYQNISKKYLFTRSRFHENALNRSRSIGTFSCPGCER